LILFTAPARNESTIEPKNALKNPLTSKPGVIFPASISRKAFITRVNKPRVIKFTGSDINIKTGFIKALISAIITHASIALKKFSMSMPGIIHAVNIIKIEYTAHLIRVFITLKPPFVYKLSA